MNSISEANVKLATLAISRTNEKKKAVDWDVRGAFKELATHY